MLHPLPKNVFSLRLVPTLAITTQAQKCWSSSRNACGARSETAAGVEMLGGEPGVAQHLAAHVVDDAGCVQMAATVRAASIERVDALDS
jgi:hypothetical protein